MGDVETMLNYRFTNVAYGGVKKKPTMHLSSVGIMSMFKIFWDMKHQRNPKPWK